MDWLHCRIAEFDAQERARNGEFARVASLIRERPSRRWWQRRSGNRRAARSKTIGLRN